MTSPPREPTAPTDDGWFVRLVDRLIPPELLVDQESQLRSRVLVTSTLSVTVLALIANTVRLVTVPVDTGLIIAYSTIAVFAALPWLQRVTRSYRLAGGCFIAVAVVVLPLLHLLVGQFPAPILLFFPLVPLFGALLVGVRFGIVTAVVMTAQVVALKLVLPPLTGELAAVLSWTFAALAVAVCLINSFVAAAYERARQRSARELEDARARAETASRSKSEFLRHMSHELRTPLNAILGYGELLQEELADAGADRFAADVEKIRGASAQLLSLITDLLDISRIEAGAVDLELTDVPPAALLAEVRDTTAPLAAANHNQVVLDVAGGLPDLRTDRHRLRQVLLNLTSNACKFTERGRVVLSAAADPDDPLSILLQVRDTGVGMSAAQLARIFEPFVQVHASIDRRRQGSGLGLTISRRLVEALGGTIRVDSQPGQGTTFTVRLPRIHPAVVVSTVSSVSRLSRP